MIRRRLRFLSPRMTLAIVLVTKLALAASSPLEFSGSTTTADGKENAAFEDWDDHIGRPIRAVTFDDLDLFKFTAQWQVAIKTGGDLALMVSSLIITPDSDLGTFQGIGNANDLTKPNVHSLLADAGMKIVFNFLDRLENGIPTFGTTEAVGGFVSTLGAVNLEIFDVNGQSLGAITKTPESTSPFFLGFVFPDDQGQQPVIARAEFTFTSEGAFDGLVFTSVNAIQGEPVPPGPAPPPESE